MLGPPPPLPRPHHAELRRVARSQCKVCQKSKSWPKGSSSSYSSGFIVRASFDAPPSAVYQNSANSQFAINLGRRSYIVVKTRSLSLLNIAGAAYYTQTCVFRAGAFLTFVFFFLLASGNDKSRAKKESNKTTTDDKARS